MGFDTSGGGDPEAGGGGTIFDDPQFMQSLQGVMQQQPQGNPYGSGDGIDPRYQQAMERRKRDQMRMPDYGDPRRGQGLGAGGGGVVSAPDGTVYGGGATSPFEVGGNSGGGGDPNDPNSYQYMVRHPPSFPMDIGPGSANERAQAAWQKKLEEARLRDSGRPISAGNGYGGAQPPGGGGYGGYGGGVENTPGGMDLQDLARRFAQPNPHYGDLSWGERMRGREGDPRDMGNGQMAGGMPPWMQRRNPGTRDDMRRGYWDRGMNDQGGMGGRRPLGPESRGGWYGGYGNQGGGGQQQFYGPQGPQGQTRPDSSNPGAAYDAGPGKWEAQQQAARDQGAQQGAPPRWQMPQGGAYGRPQMQRRRRFYGNSGAIQGPQASGGGVPVPVNGGGGYAI